jgi:geranylgeranyl reductase family protein
VVGAGPAGAKAAEVASRHGVRVLLVDKRNRPGTPVQCAEYVPLAVRRYARLVPGSVAQKIDGMQTYINGRLVSTMTASGYVLHRSVFDEGLVLGAQEAGAELWLGTRAVARTERGIEVHRTGQGEEEIACRVIIGADGPRSTVGKWIQSQNAKFIAGLQYQLPLCGYQSLTEIYFRPEYAGGYAWLFPKGDTGNVGVGVYPSQNCRLRGLLQDFIRQLAEAGKLASAKPLKQTGGLIPVGGPLPITQRDNILLVGDAAGQTHPVTGAGIMSAIVCGELAGQVAAKAIIQEDMTLLANYPREWQKIIGRFLARATKQREDYDRNWTHDPEQFTGLIKRTWISFAG